MSPLFLTIFLAFLLTIIALMGLAIGWLITGRSKIQAGACGRAPTKKKDDSCGSNVTCSLCEKKDVESDK